MISTTKRKRVYTKFVFLITHHELPEHYIKSIKIEKIEDARNLKTTELIIPDIHINC